MHMLNSGSEFSHEEYGIVPLNVILFLIYAYFLGSTTYKIIRTALNKEEIENPIIGMIFAIYLELLHIGSQSVHLYFYSRDGSGYFILDLVSTMLQMNSQIILIGLLTLIAFGWSITDLDVTKDIKYIILGGAVLVAHAFSSLLTAIDDGAHHKYHDYSGFQGFMIVFLRLGTYVVFMYGVTKTIKILPKKGQTFLKALGVAGTLYILAFPSMWVLSYVISLHLRNRFIVYGNLLVQLVAIIILLNQLSKKGTKYYHASEKSKVVLPGKVF